MCCVELSGNEKSTISVLNCYFVLTLDVFMYLIVKFRVFNILKIVLILLREC